MGVEKPRYPGLDHEASIGPDKDLEFYSRGNGKQKDGFEEKDNVISHAF